MVMGQVYSHSASSSSVSVVVVHNIVGDSNSYIAVGVRLIDHCSVNHFPPDKFLQLLPFIGKTIDNSMPRSSGRQRVTSTQSTQNLLTQTCGICHLMF